jgi:3-hydroxyacyl-CoA dehydrogenase
MNQVVSTELKGAIAVIRIDSPPVNAISLAVREGVIEAFSRVKEDENIRGAVLCCAGRTFIAGADISEFGKSIPGPTLLDMLACIEGCGKLVVVAIHGTALGGGLETSMACNYRIAVKGARVGLPEVHLGLLPGAGGTQLLPRLNGVAPALEAMLSGRMIPVSEAAELGVIDRVVEDDLENEAISYAQSLIDSDSDNQTGAGYRDRSRDCA